MFSNKNYNFLFFIFLSFLLIFCDLSFNCFNNIKFYFKKFNFIFYYLYNKFNIYISNKKKYLNNIDNLIYKNISLNKENIVLKNKLHILNNIKEKNNKLNNILDLYILKKKNFTIVKLISPKSGENDILFVNSINNSFINYGNLFFNGIGILGKIIGLNKNIAELELICHKGSGILGKIFRNNMEVVVLGFGCLNDMKIYDIPFNSDIKKGDIIITYSLNSSIFVNYPIGIIKNVYLDKNCGCIKANVKSFIKYNKLEFGILI